MEQGWKTVLSKVREEIQKSCVNPTLINYYLKEQDKKVVRRIKRVVTEELKKQAVLYQKTTSHQRCASENALQHKNEPPSNADFSVAEWEIDSFSMDENFSFSAQATSSKVSLIDKQMRYAVKSTPEERKRAKFQSFADSDEENNARDDHESSDEDVRPAPKKKTLREVSYEAQSAHSKMCEQATSSMSLMSKVLNKLEKKIRWRIDLN